MRVRLKWSDVIIPAYVPVIVFVKEERAIFITPDDEESERIMKKVHSRIIEQVRDANYEVDGDYLLFEVGEGEDVREFFEEVRRELEESGFERDILEILS